MLELLPQRLGRSSGKGLCLGGLHPLGAFGSSSCWEVAPSIVWRRLSHFHSSYSLGIGGGDDWGINQPKCSCVASLEEPQAFRAPRLYGWGVLRLHSACPSHPPFQDVQQLGRACSWACPVVPVLLQALWGWYLLTGEVKCWGLRAAVVRLQPAYASWGCRAAAACSARALEQQCEAPGEEKPCSLGAPLWVVEEHSWGCELCRSEKLADIRGWPDRAVAERKT